MTPEQQTEQVCKLALAAGFDRVGVALAGPVPRAEYVAAWLEAGRHGEMEYLQRWAELRADSRSLLPGARSVVVVAHNYRQRGREGERGGGGKKSERDGEKERWRDTETERAGERESGRAGESGAPAGKVAQYAWGRDYHKVIRKKLWGVVDRMREELRDRFEARVCVDTAPVIERELAAAAGIGWIGKNTLVMHQDLGSFFFLGEIITTLELAPSPPATDHCGTCTRCLDACPTGALTAPYQMDASRCISYLTIEHRSDIAPELQALMGEWVYGCDICQDVCPHNRRAPISAEPAYAASMAGIGSTPSLTELLAWTEEDYRARLAGSAAKRASREMWKRNAGIVIQNLTTEARRHGDAGKQIRGDTETRRHGEKPE